MPHTNLISCATVSTNTLGRGAFLRCPTRGLTFLVRVPFFSARIPHVARPAKTPSRSVFRPDPARLPHFAPLAGRHTPKLCLLASKRARGARGARGAAGSMSRPPSSPACRPSETRIRRSRSAQLRACASPPLTSAPDERPWPPPSDAPATPATPATPARSTSPRACPQTSAAFKSPPQRRPPATRNDARQRHLPHSSHTLLERLRALLLTTRSRAAQNSPEPNARVPRSATRQNHTCDL